MWTKQRLEETAARSFINCHVVGVDSILFTDSPNHLRMFIANENHELWKNQLPLTQKMSVALHPHHCDVVLMPHQGTIYNITRKEHSEFAEEVTWYRYQSPITGAAGKFVSLNETVTVRLGMTEIHYATLMRAKEFHSMYVPKGETASWWVAEGEEDPTYEPMCYSNADLETFDFSSLYKRMNVEYLVGLLKRTGLYDLP